MLIFIDLLKFEDWFFKESLSKGFAKNRPRKGRLIFKAIKKFRLFNGNKY